MLNIPHIPPNNRLSSNVGNLQTPPSVEHPKQDITPVSARMAASIIAIAINEHHFSGNEIRHQLRALHFADNVARFSSPSTPIDSDYASLSSPASSRTNSASGSWESIPSQVSLDDDGEPGKHAYRHRLDSRQLGPQHTLSETPVPMKLNAQGTLYQGMPRHVQYAAPAKTHVRPASSTPLPMKLNALGTQYQGMPRHVQYAAPAKTHARPASSTPLSTKLNAQGTLYQGMPRHVQYAAPAKTHARPSSSPPLSMKLNAQGTLYQGIPQPAINDTTLPGVKKYPTGHHTRTDFQDFTHQRQASVNEGVFIQSEEYADDGLDSAHLNQLFPDYEDYQIFQH